MVSAQTSTPRFDPTPYLSAEDGKRQYLPVRWRLVWLRSEHPDAEIITELVEHKDGESAVFRCRIAIPGGGSATGWGRETVTTSQRAGGAYLEKAETSALGRAAAALGYGTEHALELDEDRVVDAPQERRTPQPDGPAVANKTARTTAPSTGSRQAGAPKGGKVPLGVAQGAPAASPDQRARIVAEWGGDEAAANLATQERYGVALADLSGPQWADLMTFIVQYRRQEARRA